MHRIYLDHAATTPLDQRVKDAMEPFWADNFGNAGGLYEEGRIVKEGDSLDYGKFTVIVQRMEGHRVASAKIIRK